MKLTTREEIKKLSDEDLNIFEYGVSNMPNTDKVQDALEIIRLERIRRDSFKTSDLHPNQGTLFNTNRSAFTMIELIFVIVILGILAVVAIPKLSATRDDAKITSGVTDTRQFLSDIGSYYIANGTFSKPSIMSNVKLDTDTTASVDLTTNLIIDGKKCVEFKFTTAGSKEGNVTVSASDSSLICDDIITALGDMVKTHSYGGHRIKW